MIPCGLGARNTLRLEASMCLYGHEIDDTTTPWEAGLGWICKPGKGEFLGREALVRQKEKGSERTLVGFEMQDRLIARDGCAVCDRRTRPVGRVTSGSPAPFLKKNIGMAYVPPELRAPGTEIAVEHSRQAGACADCSHAVLQAGEVESWRGICEPHHRATRRLSKERNVPKRLSLYQGT